MELMVSIHMKQKIIKLKKKTIIKEVKENNKIIGDR